MTPNEKPKRIYSLQRNVQTLAAVSLIVAGFILITGTWILRHMLEHDVSEEVSFSVQMALRGIATDPESPDKTREAQATLEELLRINPGAWYYYEDANQVIQSKPGEALYKQALVGEHPTLHIDGSEPPLCNLRPANFNFDSDRGNVHVTSAGCGENNYYLEVAGFTEDVPFIRHIRDTVLATYFSGRSANQTVLPIAIVAVLTLGAITLLFGRLMRRVEAVSRAASRIGKGKHHILLPEDNLPREVLPMVQAINRAIGRLEASSEQQALFVAAAAHELRTPLTIYRARLEEMEESELKDALVADLQRMDAMVTQLLALAKLGAAELDLEKLDLAEVVRTTCVERGGAVFAAGKKLAYDNNGESTDILGDRESVKTAVSNLIDNALQYTPEGKTVHVGVAGNCVTILDKGPGVAQEDRDRIFEPFFKNPPNKPGHGLGLAIVYEIMRIHEGSVNTHNATEGGAVFELTFQRAA